MSKDKSKRRSLHSVNKDLFIPPELYGVMEIPDEADEDLKPNKAETNHSSKRVSFHSPEKNKGLLNGNVSPSKQRKNPFNSGALVDETDLGQEAPNQNVKAGQVNGTEETKPDIMSSIVKYGVKLPYPAPKEDRRVSLKVENDSSPNPVVLPPTPKPRSFLTNGKSPIQGNSPLNREDSTNGKNRRGILKRRSSSSSTDSESIRIAQNIEPNKISLPVSPIPETVQNNIFDEQVPTAEGSPDRLKQVRFSENVQQKPPSPRPEPYVIRETDEFGILEPSVHPRDLDEDPIARNTSKESITFQYPVSDGNYENLSDTLLENARDPVTLSTPSSTISSLSVEEQLLDPDEDLRNDKEQRLLENPHPEISIDYTDNDALYSTVTPKSTSPDQEFYTDDVLTEPRFFGQGWRKHNIHQNETPLVFGQSYGGGGKITFETSNPTRKRDESYAFTSEPVLVPERTENIESSYYDLENQPTTMSQHDDNHVESRAPWRRQISLTNTDSWRQPSADITKQKTSMVEKVPKVDFKDEDINSKLSIGEYKGTAKYESIFLRNKHSDQDRPVGLTNSFPVVQNVPEPYRPVQTNEMFLQENRDLPKSANFKVMTLKERVNEMPSQQMPDRSQFQSLKHFWNAEEKSQPRGDVDTLPNKITDVLNRSKSTKADLKQRNSKEIPADDIIPPNSLSDEEETSQKVASWLAQTPTVYGAEPIYPDEEVIENIQKLSVNKKSNAEDFAKGLQKLQVEALEAPRITETEKVRTEEHDLAPSNKIPPTVSVATMNSLEKVPPFDADGKSMDISFYKRVRERSDNPANTTSWNIHPKPSVFFENNGGVPVQETVEKTLAPAKESSALNIGFEKLCEEYQTEELPEEEASVPEEDIEKSTAPKSQDQQEFISSLKRLEMEASTLHNENQENLSEEEMTPSTVTPSKTSYKIGFEHFSSPEDHGQLETPIDHSLEYEPKQYYTLNNEDSVEAEHEIEETIEETKISNANAERDLHYALEKLELEASETPHINEHISDDEQDIGFEKPKNIPTLQTKMSTVQNSDIHPSTSLSHMESDLQYPYSKKAGRSIVEVEEPPKEDSFVIKPMLHIEQPNDQKNLPGEEEQPIKKTITETQENSDDFQNRLMQLQAEAAKFPEEPEDLPIDDNVRVLQFPDRKIISKKVFPNIEAITASDDQNDGQKTIEIVRNESSWSKPKDANEQTSPVYSRLEELAKHPRSAKQSGSYKGSARNVLYKKPEHSAAVTNSEQDKVDSDSPKEDTLGTTNTFPDNADKFKRLSQSVPSFLQDDTDGRETDSASESSFQIGRHKKTPSSLTNLSGSSGMASMSSVSGSVMSMYSGDFGNIDVKGSIEFALEYNEQIKGFHIYIYQCRELSVADVKKQRSDPYVKTYLLPEKSKMGKRKTAVKKKTLNPVYNEILRYKIPKQTLLTQTLNLSVWHHDVLGRNSFLGEVNVNMEKWDWDNKERSWYPLEPRTPAAGIGLENRGEIKLSLKYIPVSPSGSSPKQSITGEVHIWIIECVQLPLLRESKINSFVKCTILPDTSRKSRQRTRTVDKTPNPVFNHTMVYDGFKEEDLRDACVELTVWDHTRLSNHFIGGLRLGLGTGKSYGTAVDWMDSSHEESSLWERMITSPNIWVQGVLPLRMFKVAKLAK